jgi:CRP/FNR family transcriptional regulator
VSNKEISPEDILGRSLFFSGLPPETLKKLAGLTVPKKWTPGEAIFLMGDKALGFYLLAQGQVRIQILDPNGRQRILKIVQPGEVFGEAAIFQKDGYPARAEAVSAANGLFFPKRALLDLLRSDGDLALAMIGVLAHKLGHYAHLMRSALKELVPKTADYLLQLPQEEGQPLKLPKKSLLALALGVTAESLSRALGQLKKAGLIAEDPHLTIVDRQGLQEVAAGFAPLKK